MSQAPPRRAVGLRVGRFALNLARGAEQAAPPRGAVAHRGNVAAEPGVETKAATRRITNEQHVNDGEEHVIPRPFGWMQGQAKPKVQREEDREEGKEAHPEPEEQRRRE